MAVQLLRLKRPQISEAGATAVEYGIMVGLISAIIIGTVMVLGSKVLSAFGPVINGLR